MSRIAIADIPRGLTRPPRRGEDRPRPSRPVPALRAGPPPPRAMYVYAVLAGCAPHQVGRRLPAVTVSVAELASRAGLSPRATRRALARLRRHGWLATARELRPGWWCGQLRGRGVHTLIWPPDLLARDDVAAGRPATDPHTEEAAG